MGCRRKHAFTSSRAECQRSIFIKFLDKLIIELHVHDGRISPSTFDVDVERSAFSSSATLSAFSCLRRSVSRTRASRQGPDPPSPEVCCGKGNRETCSCAERGEW